ncbi:MAG: COX15/CtaA family protein [Isosphaeraceae bacterium]
MDPNPAIARYRPFPHRLAQVVAVLTWPLLILGGLVTTLKVGMAVPDWPTTFGVNMFLYDFFNDSLGVQLEHTHRLDASLVGLACIALTVTMLVADRRGWAKGMGVLALVLVIVQGVLGGTRVTQNSQSLAAVHGASGQLFFAFLATLCVWTGRGWIEAGEPRPDTYRLRNRAVAAFGMLALTVILGVVVRHFGSHMAIGGHMLLAILVLGHALALTIKIGKVKAEVPELVPSSRALAISIVIQVGLGIAAVVALWPLDPARVQYDAVRLLIRTGHQANGALVLASSAVLALRAYRGLSATPAVSEAPARAGSSPIEVYS